MSYYLVASLPPLSLGEKPPWTPAEFLFHCQGALTPEQWLELSLVLEGRTQEAESAFASWWHGVDTQIRNQLVRLRAARLQVEGRTYVRMHGGFDVAVSQSVADAMAHSNPLERELALDRCRWAALNERILTDPFGFETVLAYGIRLRLLERWADLTEEAGLERIETFITEHAEKSLEP
jgi:hypothetical protein